MASQNEKTTPATPAGAPALIYNIAGSSIAGTAGYYYPYGPNYGPYPRHIDNGFPHLTSYQQNSAVHGPVSSVRT